MIKEKAGLILLFLLGCAGCAKDAAQVTEQLQTAASLIQERPDSALYILEHIDSGNLSCRKNKAQYALLYSQALDKNYIDETSDSLIRIAVNYYRNHGSPKDKMLANYYLGRIQFNAHDYSRSIISLFQAKEDASALQDYLYAGLICRGIADIYNTTFNYFEELNYFEQAYEFFKKANADRHANYALLSIGVAYNNQREFKKSEDIYERVLDLARKDADTILLEQCLTRYANLCMATEQPGKAKRMFLAVQNELQIELSPSDLGNLACAYAQTGHADSAAALIRLAKRHMPDDILDQAKIVLHEYRLHVYNRNYRNALACYEQVVGIQDSILHNVLDQSVVAAQRDFFQRQSDDERHKLIVHRQFSAMAIVILFLLIAFGIFYFYRRLQIKNLEISKYMNMAADIRTSLQNRNIEMAGMAQLTQQLFKEKFEFIDKLGNTYYERHNTPAEREAIYNEVKREIDNLGTDKKTIAELEKIVNSCKSGIMRKLREELPTLKETDFQLLCYFYAGFSFRAISIFTKDKIENIYNRKSRLRAKIAASNTPNKNFFLDAMR
ncbi:MAG: hypothetical protein NC322_08075 [Alistipes senegalensis]|nr:hypothetical protein [Alistipes senegalensis]